MRRDLPPKYYLDHFREFAGFIESRCNHLLDTRHQRYLHDIDAMSEDAQCLLVRILNRKGHFVARKTLVYPEIDEPELAMTELTHKKLAGPVQLVHAKDLVQVLTKDELIALASEISCPLKKSARRQSWIDWIDRNIEPEMITQSRAAKGYIAQYQSEMFDYLLFLYFGNLKGRLNQFSMRDLGIMGTRQHHVGKHQKSHARFKDLQEAQTAFFYGRQLQTLKTLMNSEQAFETIRQTADAVLEFPEPVGEKAQQYRDKLVLILARQLLPEASDLAHSLLEDSRDPAAIEMLIRERYRQGEIEQVQKMLETVIESPESEHLLIFAQDFFRRKFGKKRTSLLTELLRDSPPAIALDEAWIGNAEKGAVAFHERKGARAWHSENELWRALFTIVFWPELFEHPASGMVTEFDYRPRLIQENRFFSTLSKEIRARLEGFKERSSLRRHLQKLSTAHFGKVNGLFYWHEGLLQQLLVLVDHAPLAGLLQHLHHMAQNYNALNDGYPDLMILDQHRLRFEEIKAPGDQLRRNQLVAIRQLQSAGLEVSVQSVSWQLDPAQPYVVVDVETTGGAKDRERITEVGMVRVINGEVVAKWQSLVNPQKHIPAKITALTGITNEMVADAPIFADIASEISEFCKDAIFVAHNVNFDYGFFKAEFARLDRYWRRPRLCTVRLARRYLPGHDSYSLGRLSKDLNINLENHHRALDDALAAAQILILVNAVRSREHCHIKTEVKPGNTVTQAIT